MYGDAKIPQQRLPLSKKTQKWKEESVDAFINLSKFGVSERRSRLRSLYDYYNGEIANEDYNYVLKPYGKTRENFPSKLRNYPIIKPIIDLLLGEKSKRPLNYSVVVKNSDSVSLKEEAKKKKLTQTVENMFLQELEQQQQQQPQQPGQPPQEKPQPPQQIMEQFERTYVDDRAIKGQAAVNYIMYEQEIYDKFQKSFFHYLVSGECYSHKGVRRKEPFYEVTNPVDVDYDKDPDLEFVEDGDWAIVRKYAHASTIVDHYGDVLTPEQVLHLEDPKQDSMSSYLLHTASTGTESNENRNRLVEVVSVYWKSRKRIGFVEYFDEATGSFEEFEVEDGYRLPTELKNQKAKLKWEWVNEVWEGTKIDDKYYINISPIKNQRLSLDNPSICKLPVNGRKYSDINSNNISLVQLGIPYQLNYNIFKYRMELAIARSKDIIAQFDINMIPKKWDLDKFMYYVEGTGIAWVDYNKEGVQLSPQHQSVLDMSIKTIEQYIMLLESIMQEWEKISGVNRQRQGTIGTYEGKATSQQAIVQSSHITEDIFRKFARFEQREIQGLLDYSKEAWIDGKRSTFIMPDTTTQQLDIDALKHMESEYGIFVSDAGKDQDNLRQAREMSQSMLQNGMPASAVLELFDTDNFIGVKDKIRAAEKAQQELEQKQQEAQQQQEQQQMQMVQQQKQQETLDKDKDRQKDIEIALINAEAKDQTNKLQLDLQKMVNDFELKERELDLKQQALDKEGDLTPDGQ
tara:strand:- start:537 stop:2765 length:2229 start_codon:yes stop_codon:yes gene_type:complete